MEHTDDVIEPVPALMFSAAIVIFLRENLVIKVRSTAPIAFLVRSLVHPFPPPVDLIAIAALRSVEIVSRTVLNNVMEIRKELNPLFVPPEQIRVSLVQRIRIAVRAGLVAVQQLRPPVRQSFSVQMTEIEMEGLMIAVPTMRAVLDMT